MGKTSTARILAERAARSVHLESDAFFSFIRAGHIEPWRPESREQNEVVVRIVAEAAAAYADAGYFTVVDGEPLSVCVARVRAREGNPTLADADVIERLWRDFADLGGRERHAADLEGRNPEQAAGLLEQLLADGRLTIAAERPSR